MMQMSSTHISTIKRAEANHSGPPKVTLQVAGSAETWRWKAEKRHVEKKNPFPIRQGSKGKPNFSYRLIR